MRSAYEQHVEGVFARAVWVEILEGVGYDVEVRARNLADGRPEELFLCTRRR